MIENTREDVRRLHANTTPFYVRDLSIVDSGICGGPGTNPLWMPKDDCTLFSF